MGKIRDAERSRQTILQAAELEFSEKGFFGARVDEIAARANINKRMLYAYYQDKQGLYQQVLASVYARMEELEERLVARQLQGKELIQEIISAYFDFLHNNRSFVNILMWENLNQGQCLQQVQRSYIERSTIKYFEKALEDGKRTGVFRQSIDSWQTVLSLITICFANFSNQYTLSVLFDTNLGDEALVAERKKHTTEIMLSYLCGNEKENA